MNNRNLTKLFLTFFVLLISISFLNAQNIRTWWVTKEDLLKWWMTAQMTRLNKIVVLFCSEQSWKISLMPWFKTQARPWEKIELCLWAWNFWETWTEVMIWFSKVNKDSHWQRTCDQDIWPNNEFSSLIEWSRLDLNKNINIKIIPWNNQKIDKTYIYVPKTATWDIRWCVSYNIKWDVSRWSWSLFDVIVHKTIPIKIIVTWDVYNKQRLDDTKEAIDYNKSTILKWIIWIIWLRLISSIIGHFRHKKKRHHHKQ